jgi:hypothetical protein
LSLSELLYDFCSLDWEEFPLALAFRRSESWLSRQCASTFDSKLLKELNELRFEFI